MEENFFLCDMIAFYQDFCPVFLRTTINDKENRGIDTHEVHANTCQRRMPIYALILIGGRVGTKISSDLLARVNKSKLLN